MEAQRKQVYGITTSVALMVAFALGALAMRGNTALAAAATAVTVTPLGLKTGVTQLDTVPRIT
ncbi:MAG: hypothetical protein K0U68_04520 [Gammaproteobacteria bacterium]|nr:hypothetical protein [Gammaproteobacteria bacterium]